MHATLRTRGSRLPFLIAGALALALSGPRPALADAAKHSISYSKIIDLSHVISPDIPLWPGDPAVEFRPIADIDKDGYYLRSFAIGEHSATHMNAPSSFHAGGAGIDGYAAESLVAPAVVIDIAGKAAANADYAATVEDIAAWEAKNGRIPAGSVVLLATGWAGKWGDPTAFMNVDSEGKLHFPGFAGDTTKFLLAERGIAGVGIDTHGVDPGLDEEFATNSQVLEQPRIVLENLDHLDQLPPTGSTLVIGLLRLKDGSGSPVSVLAFVP
jgi:kynurenine formamidase